MTLPANIRVNVGAPFPALVMGSGPVTLSKANGVWTIGFNIANLAAASGSSANQYVAVWDTALGIFQKLQVSALPGGGGVSSLARTQRVATTTPVTVATTDQDIFVKLAATGAVSVNLGSALGRAGISVRIKDLKGDAGTNNITINRNGTDLFDDGSTAFVINTNFDEVELVPVLAGAQWYWSVQ